VVRLVYEIINRILYFKDNEFGLRLYILSIMEVEVFKLTYNEIGHPGYTYIYKRLTEGLYIYNISKKLYKFI